MREFGTFQEAFDYCREADKPITATVEGARWKLYPSGRADELDAPPTVTESHAAEGTWSWLCVHGQDRESCWECNQSQL